MMQHPPSAANGATPGSGDQQAYHHHQQQSWMMQQQQPGQSPAGWNQQSAPSSVPPQQQQYGNGGSQNQGSVGEIRSLWIGDLQPWMDETYLMNIFAVSGDAQSAKVIRNKQNSYSEGYGFIEFSNHAAAERVLQSYNGAQMPNSEQTFRLNWAQIGAGERRQAEGPEHTVFVGDLAPDVTDQMLAETFKSFYSSVKGAKVVTDRTTGRSKGYGFVKFGDENEQIRAMTEMNGQYCSSRPMRTGPAANKKPFTMQPASYQNTQGNPGESDPTNTTIFVGALDESVTEDVLNSIFGKFGELVHVKIPAGKRCGFVQYADRACAEQALSMLNGTQIGGQNVRLSWGRGPSNRQTQPDQGQYGGGGGGYYGYPPQGYDAYGYAHPPHDPNAYYGGYPAGYGNYQHPGGYQQQQQ